MRVAGFGLELGVELDGEIPRMIFDFDDFDEVSAGVDAGDGHAFFLKFRNVGVVDFEAVAVAFADVGFFVSARGDGSRSEGAFIAAEAHGGAFVDDLLLFLHQVDDGVGCFAVELGGVGVFEF